MHKGIILLTKANNKELAIKQIIEFLKENDDKVFDWYQIGGRWTNTLSIYNKEFLERSKEIIKISREGFYFISEIKEKQYELQKLWESLGAIGLNPYCDHYRLPKEGNSYDVIPLSQCIDIVKEWEITIESIEEKEKQAKKWLKNDNKLDWNMYGYCLEIVAKLYQQRFCFDCNIFNIETYDYSIPKDIENYYAIMIDIHN